MEDVMLRRTQNHNVTLPIILLGLLMTSTVSQADSSVVWQIGKFDESSHEFRQGTPPTDPVFVVGKSDPARDWCSEQPVGAGYAPAISDRATSEARPFTVRFELPQPPQGLYTLKLSLLAYSPRLPILEASVNGHYGRFYQHPVLNYSAGDMRGHFIPHYSKTTITFDVPTRLLNPGTNTLVLRAINEPAGGVGLITYDALALEHDPTKSYSDTAISVEVLPTIFYKNRSNRLVELVDVFVRYNEPPQKGQVTLALGPDRVTQELATGTEFGEQKLSLEIPEFNSPTTAQVSLVMNGRAHTFSAKVEPGKKWNVFVVPHQHLDVAYTDYPPKVAEVQSRAIDEAMDMIREHPDFRYSLDAYWVAEQFMEGRSEEQRKEFLRLIREKKIFVPAVYVQNYTGPPNTEYLVRSLYPGYNFQRQHGGGFEHTILSDIPSYSWSYPSVAAGAGLKYLMLASNQDLGPILLLGRLHERSPFWWEGPDGQRILTWYSRHYMQVSALFGLPCSLEAGRDSLPTFLQAYTRSDYSSDAVIVFGTQVENTDLHPEQAVLAGAWNELYAYPKLKFAGVAEAMEYIAKQMGNSIPVIRGDGVPYWNGAQRPLDRENEHRVLAAEKFSTISSLVNSRIWPDRQALEQLWKGLLAAEGHSATSGGRSGALRARHYNELLTIYNARLLEDVLARGMSALADSIQAPSGTLIVFNPLNWRRSELVEFNLGVNQELVDRTTNEAVPVEELADPPAFGAREN